MSWSRRLLGAQGDGTARLRRPPQRGGDRKKVYVFLTPKGRRLREKLVPLAEEVNRIAVRGVRPTDIAAARTVLLAIIENLARDEQAADADAVDPRTGAGEGGRTKTLLRRRGAAMGH